MTLLIGLFYFLMISIFTSWSLGESLSMTGYLLTYLYPITAICGFLIMGICGVLGLIGCTNANTKEDKTLSGMLVIKGLGSPLILLYGYVSYRGADLLYRCNQNGEIDWSLVSKGLIVLIGMFLINWFTTITIKDKK